MAVTGPDFISLQVRDLERSAAFYEKYLGLKRSDAGPPHAVVFDTKQIASRSTPATTSRTANAIGLVSKTTACGGPAFERFSPRYCS